MTSSSVVLPAPLGPMTTRSSPCIQREVQLVQRLEAAEADRHVLDAEDRVCRRNGLSIESAIMGPLTFGSRPLSPVAVPNEFSEQARQLVQRNRRCLPEENHHEDEQTAQQDGPIVLKIEIGPRIHPACR